MAHHAEVLLGGACQRRLPTWRDLVAVMLVLAALLLVSTAARQMILPWAIAQPPVISLSPTVLSLYALRTTMRGLLALAASLLFTFTYATLAAKRLRAERVLLPLLDVLQSVPILGYLSCTVAFFVTLFAGSALRPECAGVLAIFTSQAWNRALSFYRCLRTVTSWARYAELFGYNDELRHFTARGTPP